MVVEYYLWSGNMLFVCWLILVWLRKDCFVNNLVCLFVFVGRFDLFDNVVDNF